MTWLSTRYCVLRCSLVLGFCIDILSHSSIKAWTEANHVNFVLFLGSLPLLFWSYGGKDLSVGLRVFSLFCPKLSSDALEFAVWVR